MSIILAALAFSASSLGNLITVIDGWQLRRDDKGNCSLNRQLITGSQAVIASFANDPKPMISLWNDTWLSLKTKKTVTVSIEIEAMNINAEQAATVLVYQGSPSIAFGLPWETLGRTVGNVKSSRADINIRMGDKLIGSFPTGSTNALGALKACAGAADPFAGQ